MTPAIEAIQELTFPGETVVGLFAGEKIEDITDVDELFVALTKRKQLTQLKSHLLIGTGAI